MKNFKYKNKIIKKKMKKFKKLNLINMKLKKKKN